MVVRFIFPVTLATDSEKAGSGELIYRHDFISKIFCEILMTNVHLHFCAPEVFSYNPCFSIHPFQDALYVFWIPKFDIDSSENLVKDITKVSFRVRNAR